MFHSRTGALAQSRNAAGLIEQLLDEGSVESLVFLIQAEKQVPHAARVMRQAAELLRAFGELTAVQFMQLEKEIED